MRFRWLSSRRDGADTGLAAVIRRDARKVGLVDDSTSVPARLNRLFEVMHRAGAPEVANEAVAAAITGHGEVVVGADEIGRWRDGTASPVARQLSAIAQFFGVPADYLTDPTGSSAVSAELALLEILRDGGIRHIYACRQLSPEATVELAESLSDVPRCPEL